MMITADRAVYDEGNHLITNSLVSLPGRVVFEALDSIYGSAIFFLEEGDSATMIFQSGKSDMERTEIRIIKAQTKEEYIAEQKQIHDIGDFQENRLLRRYIYDHQIKQEPVHNGMYIIPIASGKGDTIKSGKMITISYKGYFLDGRVFNTTDPNSPLEFVYGTEMQVIPGLSIALGGMREGDKSKIIIPSHFAFGENGSSTGVVPPFTTVIYEVEIIKVK